MKQNNERYAPLFSVIVLSYMQRHYLEECLTSIFQQNYPNIELVVCDDWSADFDAAEVERYILDNKPENIRKVTVFQQEHNVGIVRNAQKGVELSSGEYFKLHAADDMLHDDNVLGDMARLLQKPEVNAVSAYSVACAKDGTMLERHYPIQDNAERMKYTNTEEQFVLLGTVSADEYICGTSVFCKREVFNALGGFDLNYRHLVDLPMWLKLTGAGYPITFTSRVTTIYRYGGILNRGYVGVNREFYTAYYEEVARALQEISLPVIAASGNRKNLVRCQYLIRRAEFRAHTQPDWENLTLWKKILWRIQNFDFLLLAYLYRIKTTGFHTNKRIPLAAMAMSVLMFAFHAEVWPGIRLDRFWAMLFFTAALWLVLCVLMEIGVNGINMPRSRR